MNETLAALLKNVQGLQAQVDQTAQAVNQIASPVISGPPGIGANVMKSYQLAAGQRATGPFSDFGQCLKSVAAWFTQGPGADSEHHKSIKRWQKEFDDRLLNKAMPVGMNETFMADGGVLVPPTFINTILTRAYANDLLARTTQIPMASNTVQIPAVDESSRQDGYRFGGVQAYWRAEAADASRTKPKTSNVKLSLESLMLKVRVTQELLDDAGPALEAFVTTAAAQELQFKIGDSIVNGDGDGKPLGIRNSPAKVTVAAEGGQGAATILSKNVLKMWARLHPTCMGDAIWLADQTCMPELVTMTIGTAGANMVVFVPPGGLSGSQYATLLGRPIIWTEFNQVVGTAGDLILWSPSTYLTATKGGVQTAVSMHVHFDTNELVYRFVIRMDGQPWWKTALTPKNNGPQQSCIVELATRP